MAAIPGTIRIPTLSATPSPPPVDSVIFYIKTDNVIYVQDSDGNEYPFASSDLITSLTGDVTATGPGAAVATVVFVGGKTAAQVATSVDDTLAATSSNTPNTIVKRDGSGNISVGTINGVSITAHASQHLPSGSDPLTTAAPTTNLSATTTNAEGTANSFARSDHSHAITTGAASTQLPDQANATGTSANIARADHIHNIPSGVPVGFDADSVNTQGVAATFALSDHIHNPATGVPSTQTPDQANAEGTSPNLTRADHTHNIPATAPTTTLAPSTTNAEGVAASFARGDHTHAISTALVADITTIQPDDSATAGTADNFSRGDHKHAIAAAAATGLDADSTNTEGASTSFARADHTHDLSTGTVSTQTPDQANAEGSSANLTRADHIHNIPSGTPVQIGTSNFAGAAASFALSDHVHNHGAQTSGTLHAVATTSVAGFMSAADKTKLDAGVPTSLGTANQVLGVNAGATANEYKTVSGTTNQVTVTHGVGSITLSTPQDIHSGATPTFAGETLTDRLELTEQSAPSTPAANKIRVFAEDSNGFTRLRALDDTAYTSTILRDTIFLVKNTSGSTIAKGKAVYVVSSDSTNGVVTIALAKADSSSTVPVFGLTIESIANNAFGRVISVGVLTNIDTSAFSDGQRVYLSSSTAGDLTSTKPTSPNIWQRTGVVIKSHATTGSIEVRPLATHGEESGTNTGFALNTNTLTDGATITIDASLGNHYTVTLGGNRTLAAPTNPVRDGQKIVLRVKQDGTGSRTLTFNSIFRFGLDILSITLSTAPNTTDYIGMIYNSADTKWDVVATSRGYT